MPFILFDRIHPSPQQPSRKLQRFDLKGFGYRQLTYPGSRGKQEGVDLWLPYRNSLSLDSNTRELTLQKEEFEIDIRSRGKTSVLEYAVDQLYFQRPSQ